MRKVAQSPSLFPMPPIVDGVMVDNASLRAPYQKNSETSQMAAEQQSPKAATKRELVYQFIESQGDYGATEDEIASALRMLVHTVAPRCWELAGKNRKANLPVRIITNGQRRKTRSDSWADVYVVVTEGGQQ